jgi:hypothetical protein
MMESFHVYRIGVQFLRKSPRITDVRMLKSRSQKLAASMRSFWKHCFHMNYGMANNKRDPFGSPLQLLKITALGLPTTASPAASTASGKPGPAVSYDDKQNK